VDGCMKVMLMILLLGAGLMKHKDESLKEN